MQDKIDKLIETVSEIKTDIAVMKRDVQENKDNLIVHMKRSDALENHVEEHRKEFDQKLDVALLPIKLTKVAGKALGLLAIILGIVLTIKQLI